jgi:WD domain, G-beta repeat
VVGGPSRLVKVLGNPGDEIIHTFRKPTEWVTSASFSPDGLLVAAGDRFGGLFLWETRSGREFLALRGHAKAVTAIAFLAGRDAMVTAGEDGRLQVWDLHTGRMASGWEAHPGGALGMDVDPSGRIASAGRDRHIKVWDSGGRSTADLGPPTDQATCVSWSPDGRSLVSGDCSGELRLWSLDGSTSIPLPMPLASKPTTTALVVPELAPARPHVSRPTPIPARADRKPAVPGEGDDLDAALASARAAAVAAEKTVADLSRLARSRSRTTDSTDPRNAAPSSVLEALDAARAGLTSLRAALAADPGDAAMARAVAETERAVRLLEEKRDRMRTAAERP